MNPPDSNPAESSAGSQADNERIRCELCPHRCRLSEGQRGLCYARRAENGRVVLTTYGRISSVAEDPVGKKPLYHFLPGTRTLSIGTLGCNLSCRFCQNSPISHPADDGALRARLSPKEVAELAIKTRCPSVSFTYNEPIISFEYILDAARACRERGIRTIAVTAGYIREDARRLFFEAMDAASVDLKAIRDGFYRRLCGARLDPVLDTLRYIREHTEAWLEVTQLIVPGENDTEEEWAETADWCGAYLGPKTPLHFSAFFPTYRLTDRPPTDLARLVRARDIARTAGMRHVYIGNARHEEGMHTFCADCRTLLLRRNGFVLEENRLTPAGGCPRCGSACPGVFT